MSFRPQLHPLEGREVPATLFGLTISNQIWRFDSTTTTTIDGTAAIAGLTAGERVVGIDFRPRTGGLYGLAVSNNGTGTAARLLLLNPLTGASTQVGGGFTLPFGDGSGAFGFDVNPAADRIRVVNKAGLNLRLNPDTGGVAGTDANIVLNGPVDGAAYDRNYDAKLGATGTTLYTINSTTRNLQTQGSVNGTVSPNTGTQTVVGPLGVAIDSKNQVGFDIAADGTAYAIFDSDAHPVIPTISTHLFTIDLTTGAATNIGQVGDGTGNFTGLAVAPESRMAVGSGAGVDSRVEVYEPFTGARLRTLNPFPGFLGGVATAVGDVNRDGVPDIIAAAQAGGGPHVKVYDGATGNELFSFFAYGDGFRGGVYVAAGDINGDGYADVITGAGPGAGPHVRAFSGKDLTELASFYAYDPAFAGGVRVAAGDFNNDGTDELVTAAGPGAGPHVRIFARDPLGTVAPFTAVAGLSNSFYAYAPGFAGGVWVATGDTNGDGVTDVITGADRGGGPHVRAFSGKDGSEVASFFAFDSGFGGGVRVGVGDVDRDGRVEVLAAPGVGLSPVVRAFDANTGVQRKSFDVVSGSAGVFVGGALV